MRTGRGKTSMHIGIAGTGRMGTAIGARLMEMGHSLTVWNRSAEKTKVLADAGATVAASPADLASRAEAVLTILTDAAAIEHVYDGPRGLLAGDLRGKLLIDMSTVQPQTQVALGERVRARGAAHVECPVGGTTGPARQGKLLGFVGSEADDFTRAKPLLDQLCRRVEHCGPVGSGALMKFAVNLPLMVYWQALGEAIAMARPLNIEPDRLIDLFGDSSGGANALKVRGPAIAAMLKGVDYPAATFNIDGGIKDMQQMLEQGRARGIEFPLVERALACYEEARQIRGGGDEISSVSVYWPNRKTN
ncbi:MAG TPA: NAD(P)-dependent oxidoreductase [Xanthobacteraceae bacterium]